MHRSRRPLNLLLLLLLLALLAGCVAPAAPATEPATIAPEPTAAPESTVAPTNAPASQARELVVFAAASLKESFTEIGKLFEAANPGAKAIFNFAGSQQLRSQLEQGAPADVFASANKKEMDAAIAASLVISGTQQTFARNRLVVITPKANPGQISELADLTKPGLKLVIADKAVPVGQYTLDMLDKMSKDAAFGTDFPAQVQANVVSLEQDVKAVVTKVQLGEADAGVVYATDAAAADEEVTAILIPDQFNQLATYPIAALTNAPQPELAQKFGDLVMSDKGQAILSKYGFVSPTTSRSSGAADDPTARWELSGTRLLSGG